MKPAVSICIPTYQAEAFITQTLACAQSQTYPNIRILISVDECSDRTAEICQTLAASDPRIEVFVQTRRHGWAGNVNFLLTQIRTPLFFFLWHDDLIGPHFIESLASALAENPAALSAYGNTRQFGASNHLTVGKSFMGPAAERLIEVLASPTLHGLARCMMRQEILSMGLGIPQHEGRDYYENNTAYFLKILVSGPVVHVPEAEYQRRNGTGTSVVDGWLRLSLDKALDGFRHNARICLEMFRSNLRTPEEVEAVTFCLMLFLMTRLRIFERRVGAETRIEAGEVAKAFEGGEERDVLYLFTDEQRPHVARAQATLVHHEAEYWIRMQQWERAIAVLPKVAKLDPTYSPIRGAIRRILAGSGMPRDAGPIGDLLQLLQDSKKVAT